MRAVSLVWKRSPTHTSALGERSLRPEGYATRPPSVVVWRGYVSSCWSTHAQPIEAPDVSLRRGCVANELAFQPAHPEHRADLRRQLTETPAFGPIDTCGAVLLCLGIVIPFPDRAMPHESMNGRAPRPAPAFWSGNRPPCVGIRPTALPEGRAGAGHRLVTTRDLIRSRTGRLVLGSTAVRRSDQGHADGPGSEHTCPAPALRTSIPTVAGSSPAGGASAGGRTHAVGA